MYIIVAKRVQRSRWSPPTRDLKKSIKHLRVESTSQEKAWTWKTMWGRDIRFLADFILFFQKIGLQVFCKPCFSIHVFGKLKYDMHVS